ncbi:HAD family phosphatase [Fusibacter paucivorans]|uniref:HAD family phosphatase n=1 Tax=Fusibacter paucivorans TaxID=76009 RepID=A0ABS5PU00_9FIRM|nr:Cof-type HAD-IIB family hydrolase [Fusibacter paucivorans]MBS7528558.1 HAD family phosphatase [Fusibacter paucivorans]
MKKLIVSDIDGTLIRSDHKISSRTKTAIEGYIEKGHPFAIATGRMHAAGLIVTQQLDYDGYLISCNGAVVKHLKTGEIIHAVPLSPDDIRVVLKYCRENDVYFHLYDNDVIYAVEEKYLAKRYAELIPTLPEAYRFEVRIMDEEALDAVIETTPIYKIGLNSEDLPMFEQLKATLRSLGRFETCQSIATSFDVNAKGVNKASGIEALRAHYQIPVEDVIAFGDNENDMDMIAYAGVGVAMGNAVESVKAIADRVAPTNDEDGLVVMLEALMKD